MNTVMLRLPKKGEADNGTICAISGLAPSTIYRDIKRGTFPKPVKIGAVSAWPSTEVEAMVAARIAGKSDEEIRALVADLHRQRIAAA